MRKIFILSFLCLLAACSEKDSMRNGAGNPLDDSVVTSGVMPGEEAVVQWNGFGPSPVLVLCGADGKEYPVEISVVTASGLIFRVPKGIAPGTYSLVMTGGGRVELGLMEIVQADLPVSGIGIPRAVEAGKDFVISGAGFTDDFVLTLADGDDEVRLDFETVSSGIRVILPSDIENKTWSLWLSDGTDEWLLSDDFTVAVRKRLKSVSRYAPLQGGVRYRTRYSVVYEEDAVTAIVYDASQVEDGEVVLEEVQDRYVLGPDGVFRAEGGESSSLNINFGYVRDSGGRILSADVLRFSRNNPDGTMRPFGWVYDSEGRPEKVTFVLDDGVTRSLQVYFYQDGNLVETMFSVFVYDDSSLTNNPFAADVALAYDMLSTLDEPFLYVPYLMGEHPFVSASLPAALMEPSGLMGTPVRKDITYRFDEDGYVVSASWNSGSDSLDFEYQ